MNIPGSMRSVAAVGVMLSLVASSAASAAPAVARAANPLVTLSVFGTAGSRAALCAGSVAATAAQTTPGCVLPALDAAPVTAVPDVAPSIAPYAPAPATAVAPNLWPLLASLAAFSAAFFLLDDAILGEGDDFEIDIPPPTVSPT
jgi:hypothetical protein